MKTHVSIDGVTLTRAQVEAAVKELNAPVLPVFKTGDIVECPSVYTGVKSVVFMDPSRVAMIIKKEYPGSYDERTGRIVCLGLNGTVYALLPADLVKVG
jgi:hypothetical protein